MRKRLLHAADAHDMVEYGLLVAVVALAIVTALTGFRDTIDAVWQVLSSRLTS